LHLMINIKSKQQKVFKEFNKHIKLMIARPSAISEELGLAKQTTITGAIPDAQMAQPNGPRLPDSKAANKVKLMEKAKKDSDAEWTLQFAHDLSAQLDDRVTDLYNLREKAEQTEKAVSYRCMTPITLDIWTDLRSLMDF